MQLTALKIAGFKSFVDPQDLPIEPGLTGIVGPNGCGKSNLLEALRWAMGASSARAMRGGEMDDLIFAGADGRPARETAEVTLVLDNSDRTAPPEFNGSDTLEVLRRLKRGAGSTYKLNGRTVRGKDIQLLFADASTGANSPSLVRQGQISELIASKPQNRRRILEEAAGIAGLNTRRHEAELKLNNAELNLERLSEVTAEVERQFESLKRQARKARKYKALSEEISALDALIAHLKWQAATAEHTTARAALDDALRAVEATSRADAVAETKRVEAAEELAPLREQEAAAAARLGQAKIALAKQEGERKAAADRLASLQREAARLAEDIAREGANISEAAIATEEARAALAALPAVDPAAADREESAAEAARATAETDLAAAQEAADAAQAALSDVRARRLAAEAEARRHAGRIAKLEAESARIGDQLAAFAPAETLLARQREAGAAADAAELALHDAQRAADAAEDALEAARADEAAAEPARSEADAAVRALKAEIAGLERLLKQAGSSGAPPVIERVRAAPGYEAAVAAALGDDLQASTDPGDALHWRGASAAGQGLPAGAHPLLAHVEAPPELSARLSQCGVVEAAAGPALAAALRPGQRLVSREGHLWRWDGFVRTPDAPLSAAERLANAARLEQAGQELAPAEAALARASTGLEAARTTRQSAETDLKAARLEVTRLGREADGARSTLAAATRDAERAAMQRESVETAAGRITSELAAARESAAAIADDQDPTSEADCLGALEAARTGLNAARERDAAARAALSDLKRARAEAADRRARAGREIETWTTRHQKAAGRLAALEARRAEAEAEAGAVADTPDTLAAAIETLAAEVEALEAERTRMADRLAERERSAREHETAARTAARAAAEAREALAGAKVRLETAEARHDSLVEDARTVFGRTPEGLIGLARAGLDAQTLETLCQREAEDRLTALRRDRDQLGGVNMDAEAEAADLEARLGLQASEKEDLVAAIAKLREGVEALNAEGRERLHAAFEQVNAHFGALFTALFRGGQAELRLIDADDPLSAGLEILAQPPGKRLATLNLMSGGEQALTATALIFAVFLSRPAPICVLDEVDAPLDDANVDRFCRLLDEMRQRTDTRFIVITHNPVTMSRMDRLFGVTMREKGVSRLVSVDLQAAETLIAAE